MKALDLLATEENIYTTLIDDAIGRNADVFSFVSLLNSLDSGNVIALNARWGELIRGQKQDCNFDRYIV